MVFFSLKKIQNKKVLSKQSSKQFKMFFNRFRENQIESSKDIWMNIDYDNGIITVRLFLVFVSHSAITSIEYTNIRLYSKNTPTNENDRLRWRSCEECLMCLLTVLVQNNQHFMWNA